MDKLMNFKVNKTIQEARKRRQRQFWISIIQMLAILTAISLIFTFLMNEVWASPVKEESVKEKTITVAKERNIALEEKEVVELKQEEVVIPEVIEVPKEAVKAETPAFPYKNHLDLPMEHQEYLYNKCVELGLDFEKVLALMEHESKFDPNAVGETHDYGYFQVNVKNHKWLASEVGTANQPLNPYVNIDWGTFMLDDLYDYWQKKGLSGQSLDEAVWSSYNKGITGFRKTGKATEYVAKVKESLNLVRQ